MYKLIGRTEEDAERAEELAPRTKFRDPPRSLIPARETGTLGGPIFAVGQLRE